MTNVILSFYNALNIFFVHNSHKSHHETTFLRPLNDMNKLKEINQLKFSTFRIHVMNCKLMGSALNINLDINWDIN